jgi:hypothetical protein
VPVGDRSASIKSAEHFARRKLGRDRARSFQRRAVDVPPASRVVVEDPAALPDAGFGASTLESRQRRLVRTQCDGEIAAGIADPSAASPRHQAAPPPNPRWIAGSATRCRRVGRPGAARRFTLHVGHGVRRAVTRASAAGPRRTAAASAGGGADCARRSERATGGRAVDGLWPSVGRVRLHVRVRRACFGSVGRVRSAERRHAGSAGARGPSQNCCPGESLPCRRSHTR